MLELDLCLVNWCGRQNKLFEFRGPWRSFFTHVFLQALFIMIQLMLSQYVTFLVFFLLLSELSMKSLPNPWPWSCVYNFFIFQRFLIRGDPGAEHKLGFDKLLTSIMGCLNIYNILCTLRHAYPAPCSYACTVVKLKVSHPLFTLHNSCLISFYQTLTSSWVKN